MSTITRRSTIREVAATVSQALADAGITAVLSGGGAVSIHSANRYQSHDIDFVTAASRRELVVIVAALWLLSPAGLAAPPDICGRKIEGVSAAMSYAEAKAAWTARGYTDVTPALLPGKGRQRPNNQELLTFEKGGGGKLQNPGGMTLTWQKAGNGQTTVSLSEAEASPGTPNQRLLERMAEFCRGPTRSPDIECSVSPPNVAVKAALPGSNLQCRYSAGGNRTGGAAMLLESVSLGPGPDERTQNRMKVIMEQKER